MAPAVYGVVLAIIVIGGFPLFRDRPDSVLEIDLVPNGVLQLAFAHHGLQEEAHAEPNGGQRRHLLKLLEHDPDLGRRKRPVFRYEGRDRSRPDIVSRVGDLLAVQNCEAVNLFDDVTDVDRGRRCTPLDDRPTMSSQLIAGDRPSAIAGLASMQSSRARASDRPAGPYLPNVTISRRLFMR
jgi:hypothetical protein